jgi:hypothetical protein
MTRALVMATIVTASLAAVGYAAGAGPSPGLDYGNGITASGGEVRYLALAAGRGTLLEVVRVQGGRVLRTRYIRGHYGIPLVTYGGDTGGLARGGHRLVLASGPRQGLTRFLVLHPRTLRIRARLVLHGSFAFDALSPGGSLMYLLHFPGGPSAGHYAVRAYDLNTKRLYPGTIVDRREPDEKMQGLPVTRVESRDGSWAYTFYSRGNKKPFVHALQTTRRRAFCIDVPLPANARWLWQVRLRIEPGKLVLRRAHKALARIDTKTFEVTRD